MFYEFSHISREQLKFPYKGSELLEPAKECYQKYKQVEMKARNELAKLMIDPNVSQNDSRIGVLKSCIEHNGKQAEACSVFVSAFTRQPDRDFHLSIGDVVFFGLNKEK